MAVLEKCVGRMPVYLLVILFAVFTPTETEGPEFDFRSGPFFLLVF